MNDLLLLFLKLYINHVTTHDTKNLAKESLKLGPEKYKCLVVKLSSPQIPVYKKKKKKIHKNTRINLLG